MREANNAVAVSVDNLCKDYAGEKALRNLSLTVPAGSLFGLIGADGAGKSTLLRILATLENSDSGSARVLGSDVHKDYRVLRAALGYMPQRFSLYSDLSVGENLDFFADVFGITGAQRRERMEKLLDFSGLGPFHKRRAGQLSGGMKQKLALCCTLLHSPRLLLLDEPTIGVDPVSRGEFWDMLFALRNQGVTLVVATPYMDEAEKCDSLLLLHQGEILEEGTPDELRRRYPYALYRVEGRGTLHFPVGKPPQGLAMLYPLGGVLHAAVDKFSGKADETVFWRDIQAAVPEAVSMSPAQPGVEDVFMRLLSERPET